MTNAVGLQPQIGTKGTAVSPVIPVISTVGVQPWTRVPGTTTTSALQIAHTSKTQPGTGTMVKMTKPIASASQSTVPLVSQSRPPAVDAGPLDLSKPGSSKEVSENPVDLSLHQPPTSGDDTASNMDAMDHQPEPLEPLQSDSSGVQLGESVESEFEDILPQLLEREVTDLTSNEADIGENCTDSTDEPARKRQRTGLEKDDEPVFNLNMVALNGLTESLQKVKNQMGLREKASERTGKALVEAICEMGKVVGALNSLWRVVEDSARDAKRREERKVEAERRRDEEQRRWREDDQRREDWRWEQEKFERQELRRLLTERKKDDEKEKENKPRSMVERSFTRNTMVDYSWRKKIKTVHLKEICGTVSTGRSSCMSFALFLL